MRHSSCQSPTDHIRIGPGPLPGFFLFTLHILLFNYVAFIPRIPHVPMRTLRMLESWRLVIKQTVLSKNIHIF
jgi:hypothetical protein